MTSQSVIIFISGTILLQILCSSVSAQFSADTCEISKGCFRFPDNCLPTSASCIFFSWIWNTTDNRFYMELSGGSGNGNQYSAVAFGSTKKMADADLYYCTGSALGTGAITTEKQSPQQLSLGSYPGITVISSSTVGGVAQCSFKRAASITKPVTSGVKNFDLTKETFWVLVAAGSASSGSIDYHGGNRAFSGTKLNFTTFSGSGSSGSNVNILDKVHGSLMILAWLVLANIGVVIARHFKPLWPESKPCGEKAWFQTHRTLMITTLTATLIAFIIIFVRVGGYASHIGAHAIIGIVVMILTLLNPTIALFRCHPNTPKRPIFNAVHYFIGFSARTLGITNLFLGVQLVAMRLPVWTTYVLGGFVGFIVLMEIIFEILSWHYGHIYYGKQKKDDTATADGNFTVQEPNVSVRGQGVKVLLLAIYAIGNFCFAIALWAAIGNV